MLCKFVDFTYKNNQKVGVILDTQSGRQELPIERVRILLQNNPTAIVGLRLDGRGLKVVGNNIKVKEQDNDKKDNAKLGILLKEVQDVKSLVNKVGRKVSDLEQKQELVVTNPNQVVEITRQDIEALNFRLGTIERALGMQSNALLSLKESLEQQNITLMEYYNGFRKDLPKIFKEVLDAQEPEFPVCKKDLDYELNYCDNLKAFESVEDFDKLELQEEFEGLGLDTPIFDTNMFKALADNLSKVNKVRENTVKVFETDIADDRNMFKTDADEALKGMASSYLLLMADLPVVVAVGAFKPIGSLFTNAVKSLIYGFGYEENDKIKIKKNLKDDKVGFNKRPTGIYQEYCYYTLDPKDKESMEVFSYDIRCFVIDMLSALRRDCFTDNTSKHVCEIKDKYYYKNFLSSSMCVGLSVRNYDEFLLKYYCDEIICRINEIGEFDKAYNFFKYNEYSRKTSATGIESAKALFDCFINAYFAAKKMMFNPESSNTVVRSYDFLSSNVLQIQDKVTRLKTFLSYTYLGLLYQGVSKDKASSMITDFMMSNTINI